MSTLDRAIRWIERNPGKALLAGGVVAVGAGTLLGAGAAGVLPGQGGNLGNAPTLAPGAWSRSTPRAYAAGKITRAISDWNGALGSSLKVMVPIAFPGAPPPVFVGFASNGSQRENTAENNRNSFAEMGYFGTEGGPRSTPPAAGPYPHPTDPHNNSWLALHATPLVVQLLGHPATMVSNAWKSDVPAQTAVGLANLSRHRNGANAQMPAACRSTEIGSTWSITCAFAAWSAGDGGFARWVTRYQAAVAAAPESQRLAAWLAAIIVDIHAGRVHGSGHGTNPAYTAVRTLQKIETGRLLAERLGLPAAWYPAVSVADQDVLTQSAYGT